MVQDVTLESIVRWVWAQRRRIILLGLAGGLLAVVIAMTAPKSFKSTVTMLPAASSGTGFTLLGDLASIAGASMPSATYEPLFREILTSESVLDPLLQRSWVSSDGDSTTVFQLLGFKLEEEDPLGLEKRAVRARKHLRDKAISVRRERTTGYMELSVTLPGDRTVPAQVANQMIRLLDARLLRDYKSNSDRRLAYLEQRIVAASESVACYESAIVEFELKNRMFIESPILRSEHRALERKLSVQSTIWMEYQRQSEVLNFQAATAEPRVLVLDAARAPVGPTLPPWIFIIGAGFVAGAVIAIAIGAIPLLWHVTSGVPRHE
jgi:uncharacterized protein involved in exopolysaccharide biosynthesis